MIAFHTKKLKMETLGEYLKETRESLRFTKEQIYRLTQIPIIYIEAMERSDYGKLPADVYVKGFLKSLGAVYKVDAEVLLEQFSQEKGLEKSIRGGGEKPSKYAMPRLTITPKTITFFLVTIIILLTGGYLLWQVRSVSRAPFLQVVSPVSDTSIDSRSILLRGSTEIGARVFVNEQEVLVEENGEFSEVINLVQGTNNLLIRSENKFQNFTEINRVVLVTESATTTVADPVLGSKIILTVTIGPEDVLLSIMADGQQQINEIVLAGEKLIFTAEEELILSSENAGSTRVIYNGQDLGILGKSQEAISGVRFTP